MQVLEQSRGEWEELMRRVARSAELIAPVKTDLVRFQSVQDASRIYLGENAFFPLKEFFFRKRETIFVYIGMSVEQPELVPKDRVFFGIRRCDLNAIRKQDLVFVHDTNDPYYQAQRDRSILIGYHCNTAPSPYCFCGSMGLEDCQDLMYYDRGDHFLVEIGSDKGRLFVKRYKDLFRQYHRAITQEERHIPGTDRLVNRNIKHLYEDARWQEGVDLCLSCAACTNLCPTCYCHELHDEPSIIKPGSGARVRTWSSCMLPEFTRVAGDHVFRKERIHRFKHRIFHQLDYFQDKYGEPLCTGCGRCIQGCPTRIEWVELANRMQEAPQ